MGAKIERRGVTVAALALSCDENRKKKVQIGIKIADTRNRDSNKKHGVPAPDHETSFSNTLHLGGNCAGSVFGWLFSFALIPGEGEILYSPDRRASELQIGVGR